MTVDDFVKMRELDKSFFDNLFGSTDPRVLHGFELLDQIRVASYSRSNTGIIRYILDELKLRYYILKMPQGENELYQLEMFLNSISPYEDGLSLSEFLDIIDSGVDTEEEFKISEFQNSVTIQTIHKSKGLEYPYVFIFDACRDFINKQETINYNTNIGLGIDYFDMENRTKSSSVVKFANNILNKQSVGKEKLRVLYVAMTRAKNQLFITGTLGKRNSKEANSFMKLILSCYEDFDWENDYENSNFKVLFNPNTKDEDNNHKKNLVVTRLKEGFVYPNQEKFSVVFKNTVTGINSMKSETLGYRVVDITRADVQYLSEDIKQTGVHYHKALEMSDYSSDYVQNTDFEDVDYALIKKAHGVFSKLTSGAKVKKEAEFMMYIPYSEIADSNITDKVLIQGVVDLLVEHEDHVDIVDYKFSALPIRILKEKYKEQLHLYKLAVENAYHKPVKNMYIYSIKTGELG